MTYAIFCAEAENDQERERQNLEAVMRQRPNTASTHFQYRQQRLIAIGVRYFPAQRLMSSWQDLRLSHRNIKWIGFCAKC